MAVTWQINGQSPAALGISGLALTYASLAADTLSFRHEGAAWDGDPLFAYGATITLTRHVDGGPGTIVFIGKVRRSPRFLGAEAESLSYEVEGPWGWLERRALVSNQAVVVDPATSTVPTLLPQGLSILGQSDAGSSVNLEDALQAVLSGAVGVASAIGAGFSYPIAWDEVSDLTIADAVIRLLESAPDAATWVDYTTSPFPTLHIGRRAQLATVSISVAPAGAGGGVAYSPLESVQVTERPDLVPSGVVIYYRRIDTVNGRQYLRLFDDRAPGGASPLAENALVRTIELAGSSYQSTVLEQPVVVAPLSSLLTTSGTITATSNPSAFLALSKFWKRKVGWLGEAGVTIKSFQGCAREITAESGAVDEEGDPLPAETLNTSLGNELIEGNITPWMEDSTLNRRGQDQTYKCEVVAEVSSGGAPTSRQEFLTAGVMATNAETKTYRYTESVTSTAAEPTPVGVAAQIYAALSVMPVEGGCSLVEEECSLSVRPGRVVQLLGGRPAWATMRGLIQRVSADIDAGRTEVSWGPPRQLGPADLVDIMRAGRFRRSGAQRGLLRATGKPDI
jgi:hypothetical protein